MEILLMVTDQICNNCLWLLTILYLLNYFAGLLGIPLKGVFHHSSSKSVFYILLYQYVKELKCKIQILFEIYNINIEFIFKISNFCKKNFKKFYINLLDHRGSNPERKDQNLACYHYTMIQFIKNPVLFFYNVHLSANPCSTCGGPLYPDFQIPMEIINPSYIVPLYLYWIIAPFAYLGVSADYVIESELNLFFNNPVDFIFSWVNISKN